MSHTPWCTSGHDPSTWPVCTTDLGDIELSADLTLAVSLMKIRDKPTEVQLTDAETRVLGLNVDEALQLRDLLIAGTTHILQEGAWA